MRRSGPARTALAYTALTFCGTWALWGFARALIALAPAQASVIGALQVLGTLVPALCAYALYPRLVDLGIAPCPAQTDDERAGFWSYAFGCGAGARGWFLFACLFAWRWVMFRMAFGFPATPQEALVHAAHTLPSLLLGGGLEEIGWRGCLQPCLEASLHASGRRRPTAARLLAPLATGVVWALWHMPLFFMPGAYQQGVAFLPFLGVAVALSYTLASLRLTTGGLLACILTHAWYNAMLVAPVQPGALPCVLFALEAVFGASVLVVEGRAQRGGDAHAR